MIITYGKYIKIQQFSPIKKKITNLNQISQVVVSPFKNYPVGAFPHSLLAAKDIPRLQQVSKLFAALQKLSLELIERGGSEQEIMGIIEDSLMETLGFSGVNGYTVNMPSEVWESIFRKGMEGKSMLQSPRKPTGEKERITQIIETILRGEDPLLDREAEETIWQGKGWACVYLGNRGKYPNFELDRKLYPDADEAVLRENFYIIAGLKQGVQKIWVWMPNKWLKNEQIFDKDEQLVVPFIGTFMQQAMIMLEKARFEKLVKESYQREKFINEFTKAVNSTLDLSEVLKICVEKITGQFKVDGSEATGSVMLLDKSDQYLVIEAHKGLEFLPEGKVGVKVGEGISGYVAETGQPLLVEDIENDERIKNIKGLQEHRLAEQQTGSFMSVPIKIEGKVVGVVNVGNLNVRAFTQENLTSLETLVSVAAAAIENARLHAQVQEKANKDALTKVYNHGFFQETLKTSFERAKESITETKEWLISLLMIDIDHFRVFNDTFGHQVGDKVLRMVASRLTGDFVARYGGEEFVILIGANEEDAFKIAENNRETIEALSLSFTFRASEVVAMILNLIDAVGTKPKNIRELKKAIEDAKLVLEGEAVEQVLNEVALKLITEDRTFKKYSWSSEEIKVEAKITVSVGMATFPDNAFDPDNLIKAADDSLYRAKQTGRNKTIKASELANNG